MPKLDVRTPHQLADLPVPRFRALWALGSDITAGLRENRQKEDGELERGSVLV